MKRLFVIICTCLSAGTFGQNPANNVVEGGKAIVELIRIFKNKKQTSVTNKDIAQVSQNAPKADSCAINQRSDLCYSNKSSNSLVITIFKRNGDTYATQPFTIKVLSQKQECLYELKAGIYKYRIEVDSGKIKSLLSEGEFKLEACDNMVREITE